MTEFADVLRLTLEQKVPKQSRQCLENGTTLHWLGEGALQLQAPAGQDSGRDLLLSAGIHGNETAPVELLDKLLKRILGGELSLRCRLLIVFGNPIALRRGVRYIHKDLNRLFNGRHQNQTDSYEAIHAAALERYAAYFFQDKTRRHRLHYDLHTAIRGSQIEKFALYPFAENRRPSRDELRRIACSGISAVLLQSRPAGTFSAFTYEALGAEALTLELGKARPFGQNQAIDLSAEESLLAALIEGHDKPKGARPNNLQLFDVSREIIKHSDNFRLHLPDNIKNFSLLQQGSLLAEDSDTRWTVDEENARIIFPNPKVQNGQRAGLIIVPAQHR